MRVELGAAGLITPSRKDMKHVVEASDFKILDLIVLS